LRITGIQLQQITYKLRAIKQNLELIINLFNDALQIRELRGIEWRRRPWK